MGEGGVDYTKIEKVSLEIANHWSDTNFLNERNHNSGVLVGFDWKENDICEYYLSEINTNIDLSKLESEKFEYDTFSKFLKEHKSKIIFEPGRSIIADTAMLLTKVIYIKKTKNICQLKNLIDSVIYQNYRVAESVFVPHKNMQVGQFQLLMV